MALATVSFATLGTMTSARVLGPMFPTVSCAATCNARESEVLNRPMLTDSFEPASVFASDPFAYTRYAAMEPPVSVAGFHLSTRWLFFLAPENFFGAEGRLLSTVTVRSTEFAVLPALSVARARRS